MKGFKITFTTRAGEQSSPGAERKKKRKTKSEKRKTKVQKVQKVEKILDNKVEKHPDILKKNPKNTLIIGLKIRKVADNEARFE